MMDIVFESKIFKMINGMNENNSNIIKELVVSNLAPTS